MSHPSGSNLTDLSKYKICIRFDTGIPLQVYLIDRLARVHKNISAKMITEACCNHKRLETTSILIVWDGKSIFRFAHTMEYSVAIKKECINSVLMTRKKLSHLTLSEKSEVQRLCTERFVLCKKQYIHYIYLHVHGIFLERHTQNANNGYL